MKMIILNSVPDRADLLTIVGIPGEKSHQYIVNIVIM
jgi:hypothetical protein